MKVKNVAQKLKVGLLAAMIAVACNVWAAEFDPKFTPDNRKGVDAEVDYASLVKYGPWDDRNYQLRKADLAVLPANDRYHPGVPAFFKIQKRRESIAQGFPLEFEIYPREIDKEFQYRMGGFIQDGVHFYTERAKNHYEGYPEKRPEQLWATDPIVKAAPVLGQGPFDGTASNNETTIEYHPTNPNIVIAGSNGSGGQRMSFSSDGGVTWGNAGALPGTCCDPAMDFTDTGSIAFAATLGQAASGCGFSLCSTVYWSFNNGQNWLGPVHTSTGSSDKEWIHVDKLSTAFRNRVYLTWHQGNVMQFARSTALPVQGGSGLTFAPTVAFTADERGIGSDIGTDRAGRVYYAYPSITSGSAEIYVLRSDDGGVTFLDMNGATAGLGKMAYDLHGRFDFAIPAMESRRVFIYTVVEVDNSGGPRDGRVYIAFTDENAAAGSPGNGGGSAAASHGWIQVIYSDDQGVTWNTAATPHSTADQTTVDRFQPWMDVDGLGNVHIGWQDTRNSGAGARNKADWYYAVSSDGGATWIEETRVSSVVSENINNGQEWGDYNGLSVSPDNNVIGMTWTDNRIVTPPSTTSQRSFAGRVQSVVNGPSFNAVVSAASQEICARQTPASGLPINLSFTPSNGFNSPVNVSAVSLPANVTANFSSPAVVPPGSTNVTFSAQAGVTPGTSSVTLRSTSGSITRDVGVNLSIYTNVATAPALTAPANNSTGAPLSATLTWAAAPQTRDYLVELSTSSTFATIASSAVVTGTSHTVSNLSSSTQYYWRVSARNFCASPTTFLDGGFQNGFEDPTPGSSATSSVFTFTTQAGPGDCNTGTPTVVFSDNMESGATGWVTSAATGASVWALSNAFPASPTMAYRGVGPETAQDHRLTSPTIAIPSGANQRFLTFNQRIGLEVNTATACWDAGVLEVSTDGGTTFTKITAGITGVPYTGTIPAANALGATGSGWCGTDTAHRITAVDLAPYGGQNVQFRWRMGTDGSVNVADGWNIDDVRVVSCN